MGRAERTRGARGHERHGIKMASTQPREAILGHYFVVERKREFVLASSNGGADAIGVCSLNLLGGVSGMRFGVLPSDMVL